MATVGASSRRRGVYAAAGFLTNHRVRRILSLAGYDLRLGLPRAEDDVLVWGRSPYAARGEALAAASGAALVRVEDAFLRSLRPGRTGDPPLGLVLDRSGIYFDAQAPSDLETLLATDPLDDTAVLDRARDAMARIAEAHLTKYAAVDPDLAPPPPGYVLLIDQTRGDASITHGGADAHSFAEMLAWAQEDHPDAEIIIKTHPETQAGHREGHFDPSDLPPQARLLEAPISPQRLFEGARAVYCVTSQLGFEAILAGHRPVLFGTPFYAGWGLSDDRRPVPARRQRRLTRAQLAAAALVLYPTWYDPYRDRLCALEDVLGTLEAEALAWRRDRHGYTAVGMRAWKRAHLQKSFGRHAPVRFTAKLPEEPTTPLLLWGRHADAPRAKGGAPVWQVEDGFLRSRGLGAALVPPLSLVQDQTGMYYDPTRDSDFERHVAAAARLPPERLYRAERLLAQIRAAGVTKYNLETDAPEIADTGRTRILVPGQVEDDASVRLGGGEIQSNRALLQAARHLHPDACLIYKPHPDVLAGLRHGHVPDEEVTALADVVLGAVDAHAVLAQMDRVVTLTSTLGFEALVRGVPVTTFGSPFYAGWGLTQDLGAPPARRTARPSLTAFAHAALISYPRYWDPATGRPCPPEIAVERLRDGLGLRPSPQLRVLSKLQGWLAGQFWLWRRRD